MYGMATMAALGALALTVSACAQGSSGGGPVMGARAEAVTGSIPQSAPAPRAAPPQRRVAQASSVKEWSGEDGGSGHPLMSAEAIREAAANFDRCVAGMWPEAARRGVTQANFQRFTQGLTPDLRIMDLMDSQPEFTKAVWDYLDVLVNDTRIAKGREILARYKAQFDAVERAYGVDRYVVASIWGIESNYSTLGGDRSVLRSTATLACVGRRQAYFRNEFLAALDILNRGDLTPDEMVGSWAGAFGPTQFMPTAFNRYAVDFDGDGRRDAVGSVADLIASTANKLKKDGWQAGQTWGYEVAVPAGFNYMLADRAKSYTLAQWQHLGVRRPDGRPFPRPGDKAFLLAPAGAEGPGFLMLGNFRAILRYNPAESYALAIGHFADRLRGGTSFMQAWPRQERVLTRAERLELQQLLARRGFYRGEPDGQLGGKTREALRSFQASVGTPADGFASSDVLDRLRGR
ncbi:MAG: lytic murein transglycosylase [Afipia sp.]|nr:lytic murein transglycosylase [Afipia sp.]